MIERPDWTKAAAYRDLAKASLSRIAWEFLRRNPDYLRDWEKYGSEQRALVAGNARLEQLVEQLLDPKRHKEALNFAAIAAAVTERMVATAASRATDKQTFKGSQRLDIQYGSKWGLEMIKHPMDLRHESITFTTDSQRNFSVHMASAAGVTNLEAERGTLSEGKWLVLAVDLSYPLKVIEANVMYQLKMEREARIATGEVQPITSRALATARYVEYLRILDGAAAGETAPAIGAVLSPKAANDPPLRQRDKRFRSALKEAQRLQASGYLELPRLQK